MGNGERFYLSISREQEQQRERIRINQDRVKMAVWEALKDKDLIIMTGVGCAVSLIFQMCADNACLYSVFTITVSW